MAGSSREYAAWALADYGFKVVIAGSFGDIHYNNELNNGMLPIVQPREKLAQLKPTDQVTVDLEQQKIISPVEEFTFEIDSEWKHKFLNSLDDIGITLQYEELIAAYEKQRPAYWQD
ncbi:TPA: 3-isopropylmalate dehydratase small subunit [Streptococcus pneumoniae]